MLITNFTAGGRDLYVLWDPGLGRNVAGWELMATNYRAELQRLVQAYEDHDKQALHRAVQSARASLGQPEPVKPADEELKAIYSESFSEVVSRSSASRFGSPTEKAKMAGWSAVSDRLWKWAGPDTRNETLAWFKEQGVAFLNQEEVV